MNSKQTKGSKKQKKIRRLFLVLLATAIGITGLLYICLLLFNNVSIKNNQRFTEDLNHATRDAMLWTVDNERNLLGGIGYINIELLRMLQDSSDLRETPAFDKMINKFLNSNSKPECDKAMLDPDWPIDTNEIRSYPKTSIFKLM